MEKNMKDEDYEKYESDFVNAVIQFNSLFADYVKSVDEELWKRAVDYAKDYAGSGNVSFNYISEKNSKSILSSLLSQTIFLRDLALDIDEVREEYIQFVNEHKNKTTEEIQDLWLKYFETTREDPFGYGQDLNLFIECDHKFKFSDFDDEDWTNYANITIHCTKNGEFQHKFLDILDENSLHGTELYNYYNNALKSIDSMLDNLDDNDEE